MSQLATKADLSHEIEALRMSTKADIDQAKIQLIQWMVPLLIGQAALVAALVRLL